MACVQGTYTPIDGRLHVFKSYRPLLKDNTIQYFPGHHPQNEKNRRLYVSAPSKTAIFERWIQRYELEPTHKITKLHTFTVEYSSLLIRWSRPSFLKCMLIAWNLMSHFLVMRLLSKIISPYDMQKRTAQLRLL